MSSVQEQKLQHQWLWPAVEDKPQHQWLWPMVEEEAKKAEGGDLSLNSITAAVVGPAKEPDVNDLERGRGGAARADFDDRSPDLGVLSVSTFLKFVSSNRLNGGVRRVTIYEVSRLL